MREPRIVLVTASTSEEAALLGRTLVEERLAACANLVPGLRSIYRWNDVLQDEAEVLLIIKTMADQLDRLIVRVQELHSYDTPEVIAIPIVGGSNAYLNWLRMQVEPELQS